MYINIICTNRLIYIDHNIVKQNQFNILVYNEKFNTYKVFI